MAKLIDEIAVELSKEVAEEMWVNGHQGILSSFNPVMGAVYEAASQDEED